MSGATTELNLATAVDSDDNADYLTLSLANSLRTVDGLFNNITGHTHGGAHQGGPVVPAAGSITSAMIADGTIATADLANAAVTNAKLASDTARNNLLTNGGMEIWQRGNGPFTNAGGPTTYGPDRWVVQLATGAGNIAVSREASTIDLKGSYAAKVVYTPGAGDATALSMQQQINAQTDVIASIRGMAVSVSFRVNCSVVGKARIFWQDGATSGGARINAPASNVSANAWETLTLTFTPAAGSTSFLIGLDFSQSFGSALTVYVDNVSLVVGSQPADYAPLHPADDLARCLRYYELLSSSVGDFNISGYGAAGAVGSTVLAYKARKAVNPTITKNATWPVSNCGQPLATAAGVDFLSIGVSVTALGTYSFTNNTGGANFSAEANP